MPVATEIREALSDLSVTLAEVADADRKRRDAARIREPQKQMAALFRAQGRLTLGILPSLANFFLSRESLRESLAGEEFALQFLKVTAATVDRTANILQNLMSRAMMGGFADGVADFDAAATFSLPNERAVLWAKENAAKQVTKINATTEKHIRNLVEYGLEEGESYSSVARSIKNQFQEFAIGKPQAHIRSRAELVVVTENANAYEAGYRGFADEIAAAGIALEKHWGGPIDDRTSDGCLENFKAMWIPLDDPFPSGHDRAPRFPGCRHNTQYRAKVE